MLISISIIIFSLHRARLIKINYHNYSQTIIVLNISLAIVSFIGGNMILVIIIMTPINFSVDVTILILLHITGLVLSVYRTLSLDSRPPFRKPQLVKS